jgi:hypothetical protein
LILSIQAKAVPEDICKEISLCTSDNQFLNLMVLSSDEKIMVTAENNFVCIYDLMVRKHLTTLHYEDERKEKSYPGIVAVSKDRRQITDNHIHIWES